MSEVDMRVDGTSANGERTYTVRINKNIYHGLTLEEAMDVLRESEEKKSK